MVIFLAHVFSGGDSGEEGQNHIYEKEEIHRIIRCCPGRRVLRKGQPPRDNRADHDQQEDYKDVPLDFVPIVGVDDAGALFAAWVAVHALKIFELTACPVMHSFSFVLLE